VTLECAAVQRLQQLERAEKFCADAHHGTPVVELAAVIRGAEWVFESDINTEVASLE